MVDVILFFLSIGGRIRGQFAEFGRAAVPQAPIPDLKKWKI
jgi:hypothetical protein